MKSEEQWRCKEWWKCVDSKDGGLGRSEGAGPRDWEMGLM